MKRKELNCALDAVVGEFLVAQRNSRNYSQQNVADLMGISRNTYACYEYGTRSMPVSLFKKACMLYGVDFYDTFKKLDKESEKR